MEEDGKSMSLIDTVSMWGSILQELSQGVFTEERSQQCPVGRNGIVQTIFPAFLPSQGGYAFPARLFCSTKECIFAHALLSESPPPDPGLCLMELRSMDPLNTSPASASGRCNDIEQRLGLCGRPRGLVPVTGMCSD